jgi:hypothetical protein
VCQRNQRGRVLPHHGLHGDHRRGQGSAAPAGRLRGSVEMGCRTVTTNLEWVWRVSTVSRCVLHSGLRLASSCAHVYTDPNPPTASSSSEGFLRTFTDNSCCTPCTLRAPATRADVSNLGQYCIYSSPYSNKFSFRILMTHKSCHSDLAVLQDAWPHNGARVCPVWRGALYGHSPAVGTTAQRNSDESPTNP